MPSTVSTKGANAVLLKMDDVQGSIDTPGALLRKGRKPEASVVASLPAQEIVAVPVVSDRQDARLIPVPQRARLLVELRETIRPGVENSCDDFMGNGYGKDQIFSAQRGRGVGDYMSSDTWTWNDRQFIQPSSMTTGCVEVSRQAGPGNRPH
jgi:hypothetical protein